MSASDDEPHEPRLRDVDLGRDCVEWPAHIDPASVKSLRVHHSRIRALPAGMRNLEKIQFLNYTQPFEWPSDLVSLKQIESTGSFVPPLDGLPALVELEILHAIHSDLTVSSKSLLKLTIASSNDVESMHVNAPSLYSFYIENMHQLSAMKCDARRLYILFIKSCEKLYLMSWTKGTFQRLGVLRISDSGVNVSKIVACAAHTLERLQLSETRLNTLPSGMSRLCDLMVAYSIFSRPTDGPRFYGRLLELPRGLTNVENLSLTCTDISEIPSDMTRLRSVSLVANPIRDLSGLLDVTNLTCICMPELERLPARMPRANSLHIDNCDRVRTLPFDISIAANVSLLISAPRICVPFRMFGGHGNDMTRLVRDEAVETLVCIVPALDRIRVPEDVRRALHEFLVPRLDLR